jgi:hypothetical protein
MAEQFVVTKQQFVGTKHVDKACHFNGLYPLNKFCNCYYHVYKGKVKAKINVALEQGMRIQIGSRCITVLFLQPRR